MILNTQQLQYLIEIERTHSISQAAANLYMAQPNLSRVLRELESTLGFEIFDRTRRGIYPTEKGATLLRHARNMLQEAELIEQLGPNSTKSNRFRIALPRSYLYVKKVTAFLRSLQGAEPLDAVIRESHPSQALELLDRGSAAVAVIQYCVEHESYFSDQAARMGLELVPLSRTRYCILVNRTDPCAEKDSLSMADLDSKTEILHRDTFHSANHPKKEHNRIYAADRMLQLQLLHSVPNAFLWSEPLPEQLLQRFHLAQIPCRDGGQEYQSALVYKRQAALSKAESAFLELVKTSPVEYFTKESQ